MRAVGNQKCLQPDGLLVYDSGAVPRTGNAKPAAGACCVCVCKGMEACVERMRRAERRVSNGERCRRRVLVLEQELSLPSCTRIYARAPAPVVAVAAGWLRLLAAATLAAAAGQ